MNYQSDMNFHYDFLELLARRMRPTLYVELGIESGQAIRRVAPFCDRAVGVDIRFPKEIEGFEFFHGTTDEFAERELPMLGPIELAFIDADHRFESSLRDLELLLPKMTNDGLVLLHDTYPENESWLDNSLCSESYRTADQVYQHCHEYGVEITTLPTPPGISILRKRTRHLLWTNVLNA